MKGPNDLELLNSSNAPIFGSKKPFLSQLNGPMEMAPLFFNVKIELPSFGKPANQGFFSSSQYGRSHSARMELNI